MPLLLIAVAAKIVKWYRTLHLRNTQASSSSSFGIASAQSTLLNIGALELPRSTEMRVKAQMLLCEIEPLLQICKISEQKLDRGMKAYGGGEVRAAFERYWKSGLMGLRESLECACGKGR